MTNLLPHMEDDRGLLTNKLLRDHEIPRSPDARRMSSVYSAAWNKQPRIGPPFDQRDADLVSYTLIRSSRFPRPLASAVLEEMFIAPGRSPHELGENNTIISLTEDSNTLHRRLITIYPNRSQVPHGIASKYRLKEDSEALLAAQLTLEHPFGFLNE